MCFSTFQLLYIHKGYLRLRLNFLSDFIYQLCMQRG
uniref:Uncharacterized protein n=1 Tax=Anguilla anguilla TaxID=7936 RepID=A0A0E9QVN2_ANGAN